MLAATAAEAATCTRCRLAEGRTQVVFGTGDPTADLLFLGAAPGADEDVAGLPFVGPLGQAQRGLGDLATDSWRSAGPAAEGCWPMYGKCMQTRCYRASRNVTSRTRRTAKDLLSGTARYSATPRRTVGS